MINQELENQLSKVDIICISKPLKVFQTERNFEDFKYVGVEEDVPFKVYKDDLSFEEIVNSCMDAICEREFQKGVLHGKKQLISEIKTLLNL